jgi:hypothetical protein
MKAGIITAAGKAPVYGDFNEPVASEGQELIALSASALSQFSKSRSAGSHYSSSGKFHRWPEPTASGAVLPDGVFTSSCRKRLTERSPKKTLVRSTMSVIRTSGSKCRSFSAIPYPRPRTDFVRNPGFLAVRAA